jgi:hypothetical protein
MEDTTMKRMIVGFTLTVAVIALTAHAGWAGQCVKAAAGDYKDCKAGCKETLQTAKDACINKDHDCVEACRDVRADCRDATGFDAAIKACNTDKETQIANCKQIYGPGTPERDQCIDNAQVDGFVCRLGVRKAKKPALAECRTAFKGCVHACPAGAGPQVDRKQCRSDAKQEGKACGADCREDFQVDKDACRNLDHDCVEQCRADRQGCRQPVQDGLDADIASCKATRDGAIAACNGDASCIEQARVVAFECRDQAREDAKPGFAACRATFKSCVQSCAPASPSGAFLN